MKVLRINAADTHKIRHKMLRPNQSLEDCIYPSDDEDQTFHLGAFIEGKLVSVASFYFEKHSAIDTPPYQYRLRGMATLPEFQGMGLSQELLKMAFPIIKQNLCNLVWCNARKSALGFYQKVGFVKHSEEFELPGIGPHFLMTKTLD